MKQHSGVYSLINNIEKYISIAALAVMLIVVFWQVFSRFALNNANSWSEETARFLNVLLVYISCSYAIRFKEHIKIDIMIKVFPKRSRAAITHIGEVIMLVFFFFLIIDGFNLAVSVLNVGRTTPGLHISAGIPYFFAPVGFSLCIIRLVQNWIDEAIAIVKTKRNMGLVDGTETLGDNESGGGVK